MGEATPLFTHFNSYIGHPGDIVTKAKLFDKAVLKLGPLIKSKVIDSVVDYSSKMEKILEEMRVLMSGLMSGQNPALIYEPTLLEAIPDLLEFLEILAVGIPQRLAIPTKMTGINP